MSEQDETKLLIEELRKLHLKEARILNRLEQIAPARGATSEPTYHLTEVDIRYLSIGDRVQITNKSRTRTSILANIKGKIGVVTEIIKHPAKVYFRLEDGTVTWRAPHNLKLLIQDE